MAKIEIKFLFLVSKTINMDKCIICIGSNDEPRQHIAEAEKALSLRLADIVWGETVSTLPEDTHHPALYLNRAATFTTSLAADELKAWFKAIEVQAGRTPKSKATGIIPLDIDLLVYGQSVLKPSDMEKEYVKIALRSLPIDDYR